MATPKVREAIRRLIEDGWYLVNVEGSHRQFKHPSKPGKVTVSGEESIQLSRAMWDSIQKQAGWK
jgi:predicted RNA binding protein YcfA (HicA-like mRNA interferase family)